MRAVRLFGLTVDPSVLQLKDINDSTVLDVYCVVSSWENDTSAIMALTLRRTVRGKEEQLAKVFNLIQFNSKIN